MITAIAVAVPPVFLGLLMWPVMRRREVKRPHKDES